MLPYTDPYASPSLPHTVFILCSVLVRFYNVHHWKSHACCLLSFSHLLWILLKDLCYSYVSINFLTLWLIPRVLRNKEQNLCFTLEIIPSITHLQKWARGDSSLPSLNALHLIKHQALTYWALDWSFWFWCPKFPFYQSNLQDRGSPPWTFLFSGRWQSKARYLGVFG